METEIDEDPLADEPSAKRPREEVHLYCCQESLVVNDAPLVCRVGWGRGLVVP